MMKTRTRSFGRVAAALLLTLVLIPTGCGRRGAPGTTGHQIIQNVGSDTMVNIAQAWAEQYAAVEPDVSVEVSGGGSGTGIAALINGTVDIANCSRHLEPQERERAKTNTGKDPLEFIVGYDAMAVYVHRNNPLNEIAIEQLAGIYGEGGSITKWSQLGVTLPKNAPDEIIRISRQSNSGTYHFFREAILGQGRDFKLGSRDLHGSKDVVELVANTPGAIGYSGMGYATPGVKTLAIAKKPGAPAVRPSVAATLNHTYAVARPLLMYTLDEPAGPVKAYLDWIHSATGQRIVAESGYVPLPESGKVLY
ncbi:phosphate ABC transporter substrate-binding protein [bacterium]|nr:phosphate ABC transporter substrate-binding protein [bacterium]